jgi:peptidoglycan/LPS O-acetylase OafA/YrhL
VSGDKELPAPQLDALTGIRGIAAWFVVLFHMRLSMTALLPAGAIAVLGKGYLAVDLFFMLSGFVMWLNYGARFAERGLSEAPRFWWKRFARVWPLHAAVFAGLALFALVLLATGRDASHYPFAQLPAQLLLVQNWGFTHALTWNDPAWSISTELAAYIMFPFAALAMPWRKLRPIALAACAALLCAALFALFAAFGKTSLGVDVPQFGLWRCLAEFALGMVLCRLWQELRGRRAALAAYAVGAAAVVLGVLAGLPGIAFVPAGLAALLLGLALDRGPVARARGCRPLRALGDASYATYLIHYPLLTLYKLGFVDQTVQLTWADAAAFLALVLVASLAIYRWFEKPVQRWLHVHPPGRPLRVSPAP